MKERAQFKLKTKNDIVFRGRATHLEMASFKRIALILLPLMAFMVMIIVDDSVARELRPSYHGLEYQSSAPIGGKLPQEMKEFFGSSSYSKSSTVALPKAMNSNDTTWWNGVAGEKGGDRWRHVLLVASLGCGVTGAALLVVSAVIYLVKYKRQKE